MDKSTHRTQIIFGAVAWVAAAALFFTVHFIVQAVWSHPAYSWAANNISDLGNVHCRRWGDNQRYVCSPRHALMNLGFVGTGLLIALGALLRRTDRSRAAGSRIARWLLVLDGLAFALAGLAPADLNLGLHLLAVPFIFLGGNVALILIGLVPGESDHWSIRLLATILGVTGLIATYLFFSGNYLMLGMGGMERFAGLTMIMWAPVAGLSILLSGSVRCPQPQLTEQPTS